MTVSGTDGYRRHAAARMAAHGPVETAVSRAEQGLRQRQAALRQRGRALVRKAAGRRTTPTMRRIDAKLTRMVDAKFGQVERQAELRRRARRLLWREDLLMLANARRRLAAIRRAR